MPNNEIIGSSRFEILPSTKSTLKKLPKTLNLLPKWREFTRLSKWLADHTALQFVVYDTQIPPLARP